MSRARSVLPVLLCVAHVAQPLPAAEIWAHVYQREPQPLGQIIILGEIEPGDLERLEINLADAGAQGVVLTDAKLYSQGGDVPTALALGRELRRLSLATIAPHHPQYVGQDFRGDRRCISDDRLETTGRSEAPVPADDPGCVCTAACALVWAGGVERAGSVGLRLGEQPSRRVRTYLAAMGIPDWVHERIAAAEPVDGFVEAARDGLAHDPAFLDYLVAACGPGVTEAQRTRYAQLLRWAAAEMTAKAEQEIVALRRLFVAETRCRADARLAAQTEAQRPAE